MLFSIFVAFVLSTVLVARLAMPGILLETSVTSVFSAVFVARRILLGILF